MKRHGHLNRDIARVLATMGHGQTLVIADAGLPVPPGVECIDVALQPGVPGFGAVLASVLDDLWLETAYMAHEGREQPVVRQAVEQIESTGAPVQWLMHDELKSALQDAVAIIRTGECTPYANVILSAGVSF
ncbi:D-ribose pyranase [Amphibiibacter pelophylacis]|uniref:D-ribose pyranase n=1 Tax=Amphibiibacter pelophylacis TaxID=1799477 RepID=A0ACC6P365_9BURK